MEKQTRDDYARSWWCNVPVKEWGRNTGVHLIKFDISETLKKQEPQSWKWTLTPCVYRTGCGVPQRDPEDYVTYISAGIQLYKSPEGGQLKNQQPSKSPSSASAQKRAFSSCCGTKGMCGNASQRHSFISWLSKHPQRNIWNVILSIFILICPKDNAA